jgi:hypothetical protein
MPPLRFFGLVFLLSFGAVALGIVNASQVTATIQHADSACRAQLTRSLGDDSDVARSSYMACYREHGGIGEASFIVKLS